MAILPGQHQGPPASGPACSRTPSPDLLEPASLPRCAIRQVSPVCSPSQGCSWAPRKVQRGRDPLTHHHPLRCLGRTQGRVRMGSWPPPTAECGIWGESPSLQGPGSGESAEWRVEQPPVGWPRGCRAAVSVGGNVLCSPESSHECQDGGWGGRGQTACGSRDLRPPEALPADPRPPFSWP